MLRITTRSAEVGQQTVLLLEGVLRDAWVMEVETAVQRIGAAAVQLDLSGVTYVDTAGIALLEACICRGAVIVKASNFVAEILKEVEP